jgi:hypothetical protein
LPRILLLRFIRMAKDRGHYVLCRVAGNVREG